MKDYPSADLARTIGRDAEKIFESLLSSGEWNDIKIHRENDFGLDYRIETISGAELIGYEFYVQLKGFKKIDSAKDISITLNKRTLRYWKNKLIPILIVAVNVSQKKAYCTWFDKQLFVHNDKGTQTLHIPLSNRFIGSSIASYIDRFYKSFKESLDNSTVRAYYLTLFYWSTRIAATIQNCLISLVFNHAEKKEKGNQDSYFWGFMYTLNLALRNLSLIENSVSRDKLEPVICQIVSEMQEIHKLIIIPLEKDASGEVVLVNREKAINSFPTLCNALTEINMFMSKYLAGAHEASRK